MIGPNIGLRCQLVWYPDFPDRKVFDEDAMIGTFPQWITEVIPSPIDSQDRTVGRGGTYMQKNEKLTIVGDQRQQARLLYVVHNVGIQNKAPKEPSSPIRNRRS